MQRFSQCSGNMFVQASDHVQAMLFDIRKSVIVIVVVSVIVIIVVAMLFDKRNIVIVSVVVFVIVIIVVVTRPVSLPRHVYIM